GGNRKFILIEMMDYADSVTAERVKRVICGYGDGKQATEGTGGDFSYYELGEPLMENGCLNEDVGVDKIREYVYFTETRSHIEPADGEEPYLLGMHVGTAYYFYYERDRLTTLNLDFLNTVKTEAQAYLVYADLCALSDMELTNFHITFKKIPRDISRI
ncbi:MAG: site-specific DNA-methyltransferase, partial [Clostridiales bacterium]|nr:site-specific DNA-methyltransferase [Clostridiales bacterium]